jgi:hypothetical protein
MIEIKRNSMVFSFPEVHPSARLEIQLQRTLRVPDDNSNYYLPPGLGSFPLQHVDDYSSSVPKSWIKHGGIMFPMYQSEAMWLNFDASYVPKCGTPYPFAVKIATGKVSAITGAEWQDGINTNPQDYCVVPEQPWLDGYCVEDGVVRQFVAMPLGSGYTAEEQITESSEFGGLQIQVFPMRREIFEKRFPEQDDDVCCNISFMMDDTGVDCVHESNCSMGLAPGGSIKQKIYDDPYDSTDWDTGNTSRCFIHIANSMVWQSITGAPPPAPPPTAKSYSDAGLPWFDWYDENSSSLSGAKTLKELKSVAAMGAEKNEIPLPENESAKEKQLIILNT